MIVLNHMTLHEVLVKSHTVLEHTTTTPWHEAECLVGLSLGVSREALIRVPLHEHIPGCANRRLQEFLYKRSTGVPLPYLLGQQSFYGFEFFVTPSVLIPRPETEVLVDVALRVLAVRPKGRTTVVDIGTGSGCVAVSLAKKLPHRGLYATDISSAALHVAKKNARLHKVASRITFLQGDLLQPLPQKPHLILANLPYLTPAQIAENPGLQYEPQSALMAGPDGVSLYRRLLQDIYAKGWQGVCVVLEIDPAQQQLCAQEVIMYFPRATLDFIPDLNGLTRVARIAL